MFEIIKGHIVIPKPGIDSCNIPIKSCDTHEKIYGWADHLRDNSWVNDQIIEKFIKTAQHYHNIFNSKV